MRAVGRLLPASRASRTFPAIEEVARQSLTTVVGGKRFNGAARRIITDPKGHYSLRV
jgi:hypothetical protein